MTFEEAEKKLNCNGYTEIANEMKDWHPAILGAMVRATHMAYLKRVNHPHPDYERVVKIVMKSIEKGEVTNCF